MSDAFGTKCSFCKLARQNSLRFLLVKTALVREGVKPGEFLRVRRRYLCEGFGENSCVLLRDLVAMIGLDALTLRADSESVLLLFYRPDALESTLRRPEIADALRAFGYVPERGLRDALATLQRRFENASDSKSIPHEIGLFIGYPADDVLGFASGSRRPVCRGSWVVYGDPNKSLALMDRYRRAERAATEALASSVAIGDFFAKIDRDAATRQSRLTI